MILQVSNATLYDFPFSSASYRLRIALNIKGLAPGQVQLVNIREGAQFQTSYTAKSGAPLVPTLDFDGDAHGQSLALIEWLDASHPDPRLIPSDPHEALIVREMAYVVACDTHPLNNPRVLKHLKTEFGVSEEQKKGWYAKWARSGLATLNTLVERHRTKGDYCFGNTPTLADICLVPQIANARRFNVPIEDFERLNEIEAACNKLQAFDEANPKPL